MAVCRFEDLEEDRGAAVLVHGRGIAVFRTHDGRVRAVANRDPFSKAGVLARGLVGSQGDVTFVASPSSFQTFDLASGVCLEDPTVRISTYDVRVRAGQVEVGRRRR